MKSLSQLTDFYYNDLYKTIQELEKQRVELKTKIIKVFLLLAILGGSGVAFFLSNYHTIPLEFLFFGAAALLGVGAFIYSMMIKGFASSFKFSVIEPLIKEIDSSLSYAPLATIQEESFIKSGIFTQKIARYSGHDYVSGSIDEVAIAFSDIHVEEEHKDSRGRNYFSTIFQGLFLITSFNKHFSNSTIILPDKAQNLFGSLVGNWLQENNYNRAQLIKMDDPEFEKEFVVYGDNQIESRYILSHSMMQRLLELRKKVGKPIYISFQNAQMYLAIAYGKDLFEPSVFESLLHYKVAFEYIKTLQSAMAIVNELKLNEKLWSKQ